MRAFWPFLLFFPASRSSAAAAVPMECTVSGRVYRRRQWFDGVIGVLISTWAGRKTDRLSLMGSNKKPIGWSIFG